MKYECKKKIIISEVNNEGLHKYFFAEMYSSYSINPLKQQQVSECVFLFVT